MSLDEFIGRAALAYFEMAAWNSREHPLKVARDAHGLSISELAAALLAYRQGSETLPIKEMTKGAASLARSIYASGEEAAEALGIDPKDFLSFGFSSARYQNIETGDAWYHEWSIRQKWNQ